MRALNHEERVTLMYCGGALLTATSFVLAVWMLHVVEGFPGTTGEARLKVYSYMALTLIGFLGTCYLTMAMFIGIRTAKIKHGTTEVELDGKDDK